MNNSVARIKYTEELDTLLSIFSMLNEISMETKG